MAGTKKSRPVSKRPKTKPPAQSQTEVKSESAGDFFIDTSKPVWNYSLLTEEDVQNFGNGTQYSLYKKFGSHSIQVNDQWGMYFCVWAPNATSVSVIGHFNKWNLKEFELFPRWDKSGIWEGFIPGFK